ncbi:helix-turn-helix domain-containing protein [Actinomadura nitritigenes]|uniref:helix-turn-helix domain-containing protein n=1 Tax=Actinomadura nitritigenes TaxID=134602 RepID=UPI003D93B686
MLGLFAEQRPAMKPTDIVTETGLPMPTAYRLAPKVLTLGFSALRSLGLVQLAEGPLRRVVEATGQTANLRTR